MELVKKRKRDEIHSNDAPMLLSLPDEMLVLILEKHLIDWAKPVASLVCKKFHALVGIFPHISTKIWHHYYKEAPYNPEFTRWLMIRGPPFTKPFELKGAYVKPALVAIRGAARAKDFEMAKNIARSIPDTRDWHYDEGAFKWAIIHGSDFSSWMVLHFNSIRPEQLISSYRSAVYAQSARDGDLDKVRDLLRVSLPGNSFFKVIGKNGRVDFLNLLLAALPTKGVSKAGIGGWHTLTTSACKASRWDVLDWCARNKISISVVALGDAIARADTNMVDYILPRSDGDRCRGHHASIAAIDKKLLSLLDRFMMHEISIDWRHLCAKANELKDREILEYALYKRHLYLSARGGWVVLHSNGYDTPIERLDKDRFPWVEQQLAELPKDHPYKERAMPRDSGYY